MILLHPYSEDPRYRERQGETWDFLRRVEGPLKQIGWQVIHLATPAGEAGMSTYERKVRELWGADDLTVLEHDCVPTLEMLLRLDACPHPMCAQAYRLAVYADSPQPMAETPEEFYADMPPETVQSLKDAGVYRSIFDDYWQASLAKRTYRSNELALAHRVEVPHAGYQWGQVGEQWADLAGLGLTRFRREMMREVAPDWTPGPWSNLDSRISELTHRKGIRFHIHFPEMAHNHKPDQPRTAAQNE